MSVLHARCVLTPFYIVGSPGSGGGAKRDVWLQILTRCEHQRGKPERALGSTALR